MTVTPASRTQPYTCQRHSPTPLTAVRHKVSEEIGELGVPTVLPRQPLHIVPLAPPAGFADNRENRDTDIG